MIDTCPHCNRKLMTHSSPVCNWCGQRIEDTRYQATARANRLTSPLYGEQSQVVDIPPEKSTGFLRIVAADGSPGSTIRVVADKPGREQETYEQLRERALVLRPEGVVDELGAFEPYGAAMEIRTAEGLSTLVVMDDGSVSLYNSIGGGITGGGLHPKVRRAGRDFMDACRKSTHLLKLTHSYPSPEQGRVRFYLMAPSATYTREAVEVDLAEGQSQLSPLYGAANRALAELKKLAEESE